MPELQSNHAADRSPYKLRSFLTVYVALALLFQLGGATPDWGPSSLLEAFCAGLFAMLACTCLALAMRAAGLHRAFWLASSVALVVLGVDEFFELHESSGVGFAQQKDHLKVLLWIGAGGGLALVHWFERPGAPAQRAMALGFLVHTLYLVVEVGDGGYYQLPLSPTALRLTEELLELVMLSAYLFAFGAIEAEQREAEAKGVIGRIESDELDRAA